MEYKNKLTFTLCFDFLALFSTIIEDYRWIEKVFLSLKVSRQAHMLLKIKLFSKPQNIYVLFFFPEVSHIVCLSSCFPPCAGCLNSSSQDTILLPHLSLSAVWEVYLWAVTVLQRTSGRWEKQSTVSERHNNILDLRGLDFQQKKFKFKIKKIKVKIKVFHENQLSTGKAIPPYCGWNRPCGRKLRDALGWPAL